LSAATTGFGMVRRRVLNPFSATSSRSPPIDVVRPFRAAQDFAWIVRPSVFGTQHHGRPGHHKSHTEVWLRLKERMSTGNCPISAALRSSFINNVKLKLLSRVAP
jgi:hypothetical protein